MKVFDFSKPETRELYQREVQQGIDEFGMGREQAEMLVFAMMTDPVSLSDVALLREALKFYADMKNYHGYESGVLVDNGKIARDALEKT